MSYTYLIIVAKFQINSAIIFEVIKKSFFFARFLNWLSILYHLQKKRLCGTNFLGLFVCRMEKAFIINISFAAIYINTTVLWIERYFQSDIFLVLPDTSLNVPW